MMPFWKKTGKHSKPQSVQKRRPPIVKPDEPFEMYELTIETENENE